MSKKKLRTEVTEEEQNNSLFGSETEAVGVSVEYELDAENPKPKEDVIMEAKITPIEKPKEKDPKIETLESFAAILRTHGKHGLVSMEIGEQLWNLWQKYTGRTDRWRKCGSCLVPKVHKMINECNRFNIPIR